MKQKAHIKGQCENCGKDYNLQMVLKENMSILCPHCKRETCNWDTVGFSQFAPTLIKITK